MTVLFGPNPLRDDLAFQAAALDVARQIDIEPRTNFGGGRHVATSVTTITSGTFWGNTVTGQVALTIDDLMDPFLELSVTHADRAGLPTISAITKGGFVEVPLLPGEESDWVAVAPRDGIAHTPAT